MQKEMEGMSLNITFMSLHAPSPDIGNSYFNFYFQARKKNKNTELKLVLQKTKYGMSYSDVECINIVKWEQMIFFN